MGRSQWYVYFRVIIQDHVGRTRGEMDRVKILQQSYDKWKDDREQLKALIVQAAWHELLHRARGSTGDYFRALVKKHGEQTVQLMFSKTVSFERIQRP